MGFKCLVHEHVCVHLCCFSFVCVFFLSFCLSLCKLPTFFGGQCVEGKLKRGVCVWWGSTGPSTDTQDCQC